MCYIYLTITMNYNKNQQKPINFLSFTHNINDN